MLSNSCIDQFERVDLQLSVLTPYGGQWMQTSRSVFKDVDRHGGMAASASRPFPTVSLLLTLLFVVHLFAPLVEYPTDSELELNEVFVRFQFGVAFHGNHDASHCFRNLVIDLYLFIGGKAA